MVRNFQKIEKAIAENGFFSEYLPLCFKFDKKSLHYAPPKNCDLIEPCGFTMSRYNGNDARRNIYIPEIGAYNVVRNYIREKEIIKELIEFSDSDTSYFSSILADDNSIMLFEQSYEPSTISDEISSNYIDNIAKKIILATGSKKILKLVYQENICEHGFMHLES